MLADAHQKPVLQRPRPFAQTGGAVASGLQDEHPIVRLELVSHASIIEGAHQSARHGLSYCRQAFGAESRLADVVNVVQAGFGMPAASLNPNEPI